MDQLLEDYKAYYKARMQKYEGNEVYPNSYQSEKALYEAMNSCQKLEDFRDKIGELNHKNAIALIKDQAAARKKHFEELKETVRAKGPAEILQRIDQAKTVNDAIVISNEVDQKNMVDISIDGFTSVFGSHIDLQETIEVYETAEVPSKWKGNLQKYREREVKLWGEFYELNENAARQWKENWTFDFAPAWEERHRRLIPLPDEIVKKRVEQAQKLRGK